MPIYKKSRKKDVGNYRPVNLTLVLGKVMEQFILSAIKHYVRDNEVISPSQHGVMKSRTCLISYDKMTCLVDKETAVDVVY